MNYYVGHGADGIEVFSECATADEALKAARDMPGYKAVIVIDPEGKRYTLSEFEAECGAH